MDNMTTIEGFTVERVDAYNVPTYLYKEGVPKELRETGYSGVVLDTRADERSTIKEFCIWNAKGETVYYAGRWGLRKFNTLKLS